MIRNVLLVGCCVMCGLGWGGTVSLNGTWEFRRAADAAWRPVTVPHDAAIGGPFVPDDGGAIPLVRNVSYGNGVTGKLPWCDRVAYRREVVVGKLAPEGRAYLEFDGVMCRPEVRVNGQDVGGWDFGYASFRLDVTAALVAGTNRIEVTADTRELHPRWYPGLGIYRDVRLVTLPREHVVPGSVFITTPFVSATSATVCVSYRWAQAGATNRSFTVANPQLWSPESPRLYSLELDGVSYRYGIRTVRLTADDGLHLNGERVQLRGVCLHADCGPFGAVQPRSVLKRQLLAMKDMGVNAIRTSHNPPSPEFLDLCDEMGFLVLDEGIDKWSAVSGLPPGASLEEYVARNLRAFVRRDRNHPCVFAWSIGNEIPLRSKERPDGLTRERCRAFREAVLAEDPTRPVGNCHCERGLIAAGVLDDMDFTGWNYMNNYAAMKAAYPQKPVLMTESASAISSSGYFANPPAAYRNDWAYALREADGYDHCSAVWSDIPDVELYRMEKDRYCAGEFVWTGFDYLGEPMPYSSYDALSFEKVRAIPEAKQPRSSCFGIVDLAGIPKDRFWLYRSAWRPETTTVHILPHWNWRAGQTVPVYVYSNGDEAELFLNGRSLGRRKKTACDDYPTAFAGSKVQPFDDFRTNPYYRICDRYRLRWLDVAYEPGELKAVAYRRGERIGEQVMRTCGRPVRVCLTDDPYDPKEADGLRFVRVSVVDARGTRDPLSTVKVNFRVEGDGCLVAAGTGDAGSYESFVEATYRTLYYGQAVVAVRKTGPGELRLVASADGLADGVWSSGKTSCAPDPEAAPAYFWMWNAPLEKSVLRAQLDEMAAKGVKAVCPHPFPKLFRPRACRSEMSPEYLSPGFLDAFSDVVGHAEELGMKVWLYDEGGWPSGSACRQVAASDKEGRFCVRYLARDAKTGELSLKVEPYGGSWGYEPSVIEPGATRRFLELTHEAYAKVCGTAFGKTVHFAFTDEPTRPYALPGKLPWSSDFDAEFRRRKGYDLRPEAAALFDLDAAGSERTKQLRVDYEDVLSQLFHERYVLPLRDWCRAHGLASGGHLNGENEPETSSRRAHGALLRHLRGLDVPGVDTIWRQLFPADGTNPGKQVPFPRYAPSAAHQNGGNRVLSESFCIYGDSVTPEQMKWTVDYQLVRGITVFVFGYYAQSNAGQWMLLFEPHSGPVQPYWKYQGPFFDYVHRASSLLAKGRPAAETAVVFDMRDFWANGTNDLRAASAHYAVAAGLDRRHCDYDFIDDEQIAAAAIRNGRLQVGRMAYATVVVPWSRRMLSEARAKLDAFRAQGGCVLTAEELDRVPQTADVRGEGADDIRVLKRRDGKESVYFLVNESLSSRCVTVAFDEGSDRICQIDLERDELRPVAANRDGFRWTFPACGSAAFVVGRSAKPSAAPAPAFGTPRELVNWSARKSWEVYPGKTDFEMHEIVDAPFKPIRLGDWRETFGATFSGRVVYRTTYVSQKGGRVKIDLGRVCGAVGLRVNGTDCGARFFGPYVFETELLAGENVIEVEVANTLANALSTDAIRDRIAKDFPPLSSYDRHQRPFDREYNESGLYGPVFVCSESR